MKAPSQRLTLSWEPKWEREDTLRANESVWEDMEGGEVEEELKALGNASICSFLEVLSLGGRQKLPIVKELSLMV